ncbi:hypothetical protein I79_012712 [Cricetulus griseus]|uniref:Uncharacterized protein n=1 Tax=Cricetulus griseus TaxID=10029 RepID=G3HPJ8_CRIGR|nr:hypothetical protein I79_012712 [Cricetulus griseus]
MRTKTVLQLLLYIKAGGNQQSQQRPTGAHQVIPKPLTLLYPISTPKHQKSE